MLWVNYTSLTTVYFELKLICNFVDNNFEILQHFLLSHFAIKFFITGQIIPLFSSKTKRLMGMLVRGEGVNVFLLFVNKTDLIPKYCQF